MDQFLKAKVAIVTGAGRGLGAATAESLASAGAAIVLTSRTGEQVDAVATRLRDSGAEALAIPSDISNPEDVDALIDQSLGTFGRIDFLVNIADNNFPHARFVFIIYFFFFIFPKPLQ